MTGAHSHADIEERLAALEAAAHVHEAAPEPVGEPEPVDDPFADRASWRPRVPLGQLSDYPIPTEAVVVNPGDPIPFSGLVRLGAGRHVAAIEPQGGKYWFEPGAYLDGDGRLEYAFRVRGADVEIHNFDIRNFETRLQHGAIQFEDGSSDALVTQGVVRNCRAAGWKLSGRNHVLRRVLSTENRQIGVKGVDLYDSLIEDAEWSENNVNFTVSAGWEAGGSKFVRCYGTEMRYCLAAHNGGNGFWEDIANEGNYIHHSTSEDNARQGFYHEISYGSVWSYIAAVRNGWWDPDDRGWLYNAGVMVGHSPGHVIDRAWAEDNRRGITAIQQDRSSHDKYMSDGRRFILRDLEVSDSVVVLGRGDVAAGVAQDSGGKAYVGESVLGLNNHFVGNRYVAPDADHWQWDGRKTFGEWQAAGQDLDGELVLA